MNINSNKTKYKKTNFKVFAEATWFKKQLDIKKVQLTWMFKPFQLESCLIYKKVKNCDELCCHNLLIISFLQCRTKLLKCKLKLI